MSLRYRNKVVIVTGGSKGIGRGIVRVFGMKYLQSICYDWSGKLRNNDHAFFCFSGKWSHSGVLCTRRSVYDSFYLSVSILLKKMKSVQRHLRQVVFQVQQVKPCRRSLTWKGQARASLSAVTCPRRRTFRYIWRVPEPDVHPGINELNQNYWKKDFI